MSDLENIELRLKGAMEKEAKLKEQLEKVGDGPKADEIKLQLEKVDELLKHLSKERIEAAKNE